MAEMKAKAEYRVMYERDAKSGWWVATVPELAGCLTQGRTIEQTRKRIREAIAVWLDITGSEYTGRIVDDVRLPARARKVIRTVQAARKRAEEADAQAALEARSAVAQLKRLGLSLRDAGELLGITRQRAHQLLDKAS
jgi:predicted RNase H-like HicB family nuclease